MARIDLRCHIMPTPVLDNLCLTTLNKQQQHLSGYLIGQWSPTFLFALTSCPGLFEGLTGRGDWHLWRGTLECAHTHPSPPVSVTTKIKMVATGAQGAVLGTLLALWPVLDSTGPQTGGLRPLA